MLRGVIPRFKVGDIVFNKYFAYSDKKLLSPFSALSVACILTDSAAEGIAAKYSYLCVLNNKVFCIPEDKLYTEAETHLHCRKLHRVASFLFLYVKYFAIIMAIILLICLVDMSFTKL